MNFRKGATGNVLDFAACASQTRTRYSNASREASTCTGWMMEWLAVRGGLAKTKTARAATNPLTSSQLCRQSKFKGLCRVGISSAGKHVSPKCCGCRYASCSSYALARAVPSPSRQLLVPASQSVDCETTRCTSRGVLLQRSRDRAVHAIGNSPASSLVMGPGSWVPLVPQAPAHCKAASPLPPLSQNYHLTQGSQDCTA